MKHHNLRSVVIADHPGRLADSKAYATLDASSQRKRETRTSLARECGNVIYAVRLPDGVIKIGYTSDIADRVRTLKCGFDGVLALVRGTLEDERAIHAGLTEFRARGREYYRPTPEVLKVVNDMRATFGFDPISA